MSHPDLSLHHGLLNDLFATSDDPSECRISCDQVDFYHQNGFVAGIPVLDDRQIDTLRREVDAVMDPAYPGIGLFHEYNLDESDDPDHRLFHALGAWRVEPGLHDVLWNPASIVPASQLLDGAVRFWHDQLFCKPAQHGGVVAWHQDYSYWTRTKPLQHLTCWIALDDSTVKNGAVHYVPGSHRWDLLPTTGLAGDMYSVRDVLTTEQQRAFDGAVAVELKAGQASFHHALTMHGSYENHTDSPRRAVVINLFRDGVYADTDESLMQGTPPIGHGNRIEGQFNPLLYDPTFR
jgi:hypothetical protein